MHNCKIICTAKYVPEKVIDNEYLSGIVETSDEWIVSRTGIHERHISEGENTSDLSTKVLKSLIEQSGISALDIDVIIVATMSPDYLSPSVACIVQKNTGAKNAFAFDINVACSGFVYALSVASKFIMSGMYRTITVIGADVLSKLIDWNDRSTCVLFGDGAGGVLLSASDSPGIISENLHSNGEKCMSIEVGYMPVVNPFTVADICVSSALRMDGREVFDFTVREVPSCINQLLEQTAFTLDDIKYIVPHQANARIITAIAKKLNTDISKFYVNIEKYGNTTAASIPIALAEMIEKGLVSIGSGEKLILIGFGGGLAWGSILITI